MSAEPYSSTISGSRPDEAAYIESLLASAPPAPELEPTAYWDGNVRRLVRPAAFEGEPIRDGWSGLDAVADGRPVVVFPLPEDRGEATLSDLGTVEYAEDLIRPGRIMVWAGAEGGGKSFGLAELGIRMACAGGAFAGTWDILRTGPVLTLSEMHSDDDYVREDLVLASLGVTRVDLRDRYWRLPLMTAAGGPPALTVPEWRRYITDWLRDHEALLLVVDTATGATQVDPWGKAIQAVYADLRMMLAEYPALAIVLVVHVRKASGRGSDQGISGVLGEWGRWCDVVLLQEADGDSLERARLTVRKRVRRERRIVATKSGGLLVDPVDADGTAGPKVPTTRVLAAVEAQPGMSYVELAAALGVSKATASRYVTHIGDQLIATPTGPRGQMRVYLTASPPHTASREGESVSAADEGHDRITASPTYIGEAVHEAVVTADPSWDPDTATDDDADAGAP